MTTLTMALTVENCYCVVVADTDADDIVYVVVAAYYWNYYQIRILVQSLSHSTSKQVLLSYYLLLKFVNVAVVAVAFSSSSSPSFECSVEKE